MTHPLRTRSTSSHQLVKWCAKVAPSHATVRNLFVPVSFDVDSQRGSRLHSRRSTAHSIDHLILSHRHRDHVEPLPDLKNELVATKGSSVNFSFDEVLMKFAEETSLVL